MDIECRFDEVNEFTEKITSVRIGQLWGFIDPKGKMVIAPKFEQVGEFSNGKVWVKNSDGSFLIDEKGKISDSLIYEELNKSINERKIPMLQMMREEALKAFELWNKKIDKIKY